MTERNDGSEDQSKLFVGGLGWNTSKEQVQEYFERFGPVSDVIVLRNPATGQSRGFGFVTFSNQESAKNAGNMKSGHLIDGKEVDVKPYSSRIHELKRKQKFDNSMKIFIGGIPPGMKDEEITEVFKKFGPVIDFTNMMDETRTRSRGFGFLTFEKPESIQRALTEHWVTINGKQLEVKPAQFNAKKGMQGGGDMSAAFNPYTAAAAMGGYAAIPSYMPYYDPYGAAGMMPQMSSAVGEDDYYANQWAMGGGDPSAQWGAQGYDQQRWQQRPAYPDYGYGSGQIDPNAGGMMMPSQHGMAPEHQMMDDSGYMQSDQDPYNMYDRPHGGAGRYPGGQQGQHPGVAVPSGPMHAGGQYGPPSGGSGAYKYPAGNGGR